MIVGNIVYERHGGVNRRVVGSNSDRGANNSFSEAPAFRVDANLHIDLENGPELAYFETLPVSECLADLYRRRTLGRTARFLKILRCSPQQCSFLNWRPSPPLARWHRISYNLLISNRSLPTRKLLEIGFCFRQVAEEGKT